MKQYYLYVACCVMVLAWCQNFNVNLLLIAIFSFYYYKVIKRQWYFVFVILLFFNFNLLFLNKEVHKPLHYVMQVEVIKANYLIGNTGSERVYVYNVENVSLKDIIKVEGTYEPVTALKNKGLSNFETYSHREGIYYQLYASDFEVEAKSKSLSAYLYKHIDAIQNGELKMYLQKTLYNVKDENSLLDQVYLGGFHIYLLIQLIGVVTRKNKNHIALFVSVLYIFLFPLRFFIAYIFLRTCVDILGRHLNDKNKVGVTLLLLLFYNANFIYHIGFIINVTFAFVNLFRQTRIQKNILGMLVLIPIQLFSFCIVNPFTIIFFRWFQKINTFVFILAILSLGISPMIALFSLLLSLSLQFHEVLSSLFSITGKPSVLWMLLWIICGVRLLHKFHKKDVVYLMLLLCYQMNMSHLNLFGEVMFLDVGQGDCILIHEPLLGKTILIDVAGAMNRDLVNEVIYPVLQSRGIHYLDYVVITHDDYDHNGGLKQLLTRIEVAKVIDDTDKIALDMIKLDNINTIKSEDKNEASIMLFGSIYGLNYLFSGDAGALAEAEIQGKYNKLEVDVLKVAHHGSKTGTTASFLQMIKPNIAIISSGRNNYYGHPDLEVVDRLKKQRTHLFNTQDSGSVSIYFSAYFHFLRTGSSEFGIIIPVQK